MSTEVTNTNVTTESTSAQAGATASAPTSAPSSTAASSAPADWTTSLSEDHRGFVQAKGFKDTGAVLESYRNMETLLGKLSGGNKDRILTLPEKADAPEWNDVYTKLGRPAKAEDYKIPMPQSGADPEFAKSAAAWFHEAGLSQAQAEKLATKWNEMAGQIQGKSAEAVEAAQLQAKQDVETLKKEWGAAYNQNLDIVDAAAAKFGMGEKEITALKQAMGTKGTFDFLFKIGSKLGEGEFISGNNKGQGFGAMTPARAISEINSRKNDSAFMAKYLNGDKSAIEELTNLHKMAYPEEQK